MNSLENINKSCPTDGKKLALILYKGKGRINVYCGFAYDRVMRKAVANGLVKISRYEYKANRTWLMFEITAKGKSGCKPSSNVVCWTKK